MRGAPCYSLTRAFLRTHFVRVCLTMPMRSTQEITQQVQELGQWISPLREQIGQVVVGQEHLVDRLCSGCWPTATSSSKAFPAWPRPSPYAPWRPHSCRLSASSVHARPASRRPVGTLIYNPAGQILDQTRPDLRESSAGGRNQSRAGRGAISIAGSHAGAPGYAWRQDLSAGRPFLVWRRKIRSTRKAPIRCPKPSSTASCSRCGWITVVDGRASMLDRMATRAGNGRRAGNPRRKSAHRN